MPKTFIDTAIELKPFMTCTSEGDPDPSKRSAYVTLAFHGRDANKNADKLHEAIIRDVKRAR